MSGDPTVGNSTVRGSTVRDPTVENLTIGNLMIGNLTIGNSRWFLENIFPSGGHCPRYGGCDRPIKAGIFFLGNYLMTGSLVSYC